MTQRAALGGPQWILAALAGGGLLGALSGVNPLIAFAAVAGLGYAVLAMANVRLGLCLFTVLVFIDILPVPLGPAVSLTKIAGLVLAFGWLVSIAYGKTAGRGLLDEQPAAALLIVAFLAWTAASSAWAISSGVALEAAGRYALNALLFVIACGVLRERRDVAWVVGAFVAGAAIAAAYGIAVPPASPGGADVARLSGTVGDPNAFAAVLVAGLPLAIALAAGSGWSWGLRALGAATAALSVAGIALSLSRGGFVALIVVLVMGLVFAGRWRAKLLLVMTLIVLASVGYLLATPAALQRVTSSDGGTGRTDIWTVGFRMVADRPVLGVGAGNFPNASIRYLLRPGRLPRSDLVANTPKVAHNTYLEVLVDLGLVGALMFGGLIVFTLTCGMRAVRILARERDGPMEMLARGWLIGMAGLLAADTFLSAEFDKQLWLLLALGPVLLAVARASSGRTTAVQTPSGPRSWRFAPGIRRAVRPDATTRPQHERRDIAPRGPRSKEAVPR